ncbi:MAG: general secretion pathway protein GspB [Campylobacterota bacterium]|nr:general secretion pathway protein GspB [Campylobacterota bacterium]
MIKFYLKPIQVMILIAPLAILSYIYFNPKDTKSVMGQIEQFIEETIDFKIDYDKITKESLQNKFYLSLDKFKSNAFLYDQSIYKHNIDAARWSIAFIFKYLITDTPRINSKIKEAGSANNSLAQRVNTLRKMIEKRNKAISTTLKQNQDEDIKAILAIIKGRNLTDPSKLKKQKDIYKKTDWELYELQMVLFSKRNGKKAMINDDLYKEGDLLYNDLKIIKIERERVFVKNSKEEKWLKLFKKFDRAKIQKTNWNSFTLQKINYTENGKVVTINGQRYRENDMIKEDLKVVKIEKNKVLLRDSRKEKWINLTK